MKEKTKTIFTFKFSHSFPTVFQREAPRVPREPRGIIEDLISVFCHWSGTPSAQLCPVGFPASTSSPGLRFQMLQMCEYVRVPGGDMCAVLLT